MLADRTIRCWGYNGVEQLGNETTASSGTTAELGTGDADLSGTGKDRASPAVVVGVP